MARLVFVDAMPWKWGNFTWPGHKKWPGQIFLETWPWKPLWNTKPVRPLCRREISSGRKWAKKLGLPQVIGQWMGSVPTKKQEIARHRSTATTIKSINVWLKKAMAAMQECQLLMAHVFVELCRRKVESKLPPLEGNGHRSSSESNNGLHRYYQICPTIWIIIALACTAETFQFVGFFFNRPINIVI